MRTQLWGVLAVAAISGCSRTPRVGSGRAEDFTREAVQKAAFMDSAPQPWDEAEAQKSLKGKANIVNKSSSEPKKKN